MSIIEVIIFSDILIKVSKSWMQNTKFSHTPKHQWNFVHFFALASKKCLKQKIEVIDDFN
jgi:hypothetical protein